MRAQAAANDAGSSARMTPRLAEKMSGFSTQGYVTSRAGPSAPPSSGKDQKRGTGTRASRSAPRIASLFAARRAAAGGLCGSPSRSAASAAITAVGSLAGTMPRTGRCRAASAICSAACAGRR
jgi:hypothetical protein